MQKWDGSKNSWGNNETIKTKFVHTKNLKTLIFCCFRIFNQPSPARSAKPLIVLDLEAEGNVVKGEVSRPAETYSPPEAVVMGDSPGDKLVDGWVGTPPAIESGGNGPGENYSTPGAVVVGDQPGDHLEGRECGVGTPPAKENYFPPESPHIGNIF